MLGSNEVEEAGNTNINNKEIDTMKYEIKMFERNDAAIPTAIDAENNVWFEAKAVGEVLELTNIRTILKNLDDDEKFIMHKDNMNPDVNNVYYRDFPNRGKVFVAESGLYKLIFASRSAEAKAFQNWVTRAVHPSIRQTGGYMTTDVATEIANGNIEALKNILTASLQLNLKLKQENAALAEKVEHYDELISGNGYFYIATLGDETGIGKKEIFKQLMEDGYIYKNRQGYQSYAAYDDWFHTKLSEYETEWGVAVHTTLMLKPEGYFHLLEVYKH